MKRGIKRAGDKPVVKLSELIPEPPPPEPKLTKVQQLNQENEEVNAVWEKIKASLPPHTKADDCRAKHLLAPTVWGSADMPCSKCTGAQYQSCNFVTEFGVGTGKLEHLQCDFIWWLIFIGQAEGLSQDGLTLKAEFDIIPPEMIAKIEKIKAMSKMKMSDKDAKVDALTERYESYLHGLREWLIAEQLVSEGSENYLFPLGSAK
jgi:hypothetical protein